MRFITPFFQATFLTLLLSACLPKLSTLQITHNRLTDAESVRHLIECESIRVVDLSHNKLDDPEVVDIFASMKNLVSDSYFVIVINH